MKDQDCNAIYNTILKEASLEIFGAAHFPAPLSTSCVDLAWTVQMAFWKYANQSVDTLFKLRPLLHSSLDVIAYRAGRVQGLLPQENHGCFHQILDMVHKSITVQNES